jgi:hypothetical protein
MVCVRQVLPISAALMTACRGIQVNATGSLENGFFSSATTAVFAKPDQHGRFECPALIVANGYDWTQQFPVEFQLKLTSSCLLGDRPTWSPFSGGAAVGSVRINETTVAYYSDVVAADLNNDGSDEIIIAALAGPEHSLGSGFIAVYRRDEAAQWRLSWLTRDVSPWRLMVTDADQDGSLDLVAVVPIRCPSDDRKADLAGPLPGFGILSARHLRAGSARDDDDTRCPYPVPKMGNDDLNGISLLYLGMGDGRFKDSPIELSKVVGAIAAGAADMDGDGDLDLVFAGRALAYLKRDGVVGNWASSQPIIVACPNAKPPKGDPPEDGKSTMEVQCKPGHQLTHMSVVQQPDQDVVIAVTRSCLSTECRLEGMGAWVWATGRGVLGRYGSSGIAGALLLGEFVEPPGLDLLLGDLSRCPDRACASRPISEQGCAVFIRGVGCLGGAWRIVSQVTTNARTQQLRFVDDRENEYFPMGNHLATVPDPTYQNIETVTVGIRNSNQQFIVLPPEEILLAATVRSLTGATIKSTIIPRRNLIQLAAPLPAGSKVSVTRTYTKRFDWFVSSGTPVGLDLTGASLYIDGPEPSENGAQ